MSEQEYRTVGAETVRETIIHKAKALESDLERAYVVSIGGFVDGRLQKQDSGEYPSPFVTIIDTDQGRTYRWSDELLSYRDMLAGRSEALLERYCQKQQKEQGIGGLYHKHTLRQRLTDGFDGVMAGTIQDKILKPAENRVSAQKVELLRKIYLPSLPLASESIKHMLLEYQDIFVQDQQMFNSMKDKLSSQMTAEHGGILESYALNFLNLGSRSHGRCDPRVFDGCESLATFKLQLVKGCYDTAQDIGNPELAEAYRGLGLHMQRSDRTPIDVARLRGYDYGTKIEETSRSAVVDTAESVSATGRRNIGVKTAGVLAVGLVAQTVANPAAAQTVATESVSTDAMNLLSGEIPLAGVQLAASGPSGLPFGVDFKNMKISIGVHQAVTPPNEIKPPTITADRMKGVLGIDPAVAGKVPEINTSPGMTDDQMRFERAATQAGPRAVENLVADINESEGESRGADPTDNDSVTAESISQEDQAILTESKGVVISEMNELIDAFSGTLEKDPKFAQEFGSANIKLTSYLKSSIDNPAMLSLIPDAEKERLIGGNYFGNKELIDKQKESLLDNEHFNTWFSSYGDGEQDTQLMLSLWSTVESSMMSKGEVDAILNPNRGVVSVDDTEIINTTFAILEKPTSNEGLANLSDKEINILAAQNLSARGDNPKPNTTDWINRGKVMQAFIDYGLTPEQAAGAIGNFVIESGDDSLPPGIKQHGGGPGRGIVQWEESTHGGSGRANQLYKFADRIGQPWDDIDTQIKFIFWEFENYESDAYKRLKQTTTSEDASYVILNYYERPAVRDNNLRATWANRTMKGFNEERDKVIAEVEAAKNSSQTEEDYEKQARQRDKEIEETKEQGFTELAYRGKYEEWVPKRHRGIVYYHQGSAKYNDAAPKFSLEAGEMARGGCGPNTLAMMLSTEFGSDGNDPQTIFKAVKDGGYWGKDGTAHSALKEIPASRGLDTHMLETLSFKSIKEAFSNGAKYVTINSNPNKTKGAADNSVYHRTGHVFLIIGYTEDGKLLIHDPANFEKSQSAWDPDMILPYADLSAAIAVSGKDGNLKDLRDIYDVREQERVAAEEAEKKKAEEEERKRQEAAEKEKQASGMIDGNALRAELESKYDSKSGEMDIKDLAEIKTGNMLSSKEYLIPDAAKQFNLMAQEYEQVFGRPLYLADGYRDYNTQVELWDEGRNSMAARPGTSNHGWGLAIDVHEVADEWLGFNTDTYRWLEKNASKFGWYHPRWAQANGNKPEPWHWEYGGSGGQMN